MTSPKKNLLITIDHQEGYYLVKSLTTRSLKSLQSTFHQNFQTVASIQKTNSQSRIIKQIKSSERKFNESPKRYFDFKNATSQNFKDYVLLKKNLCVGQNTKEQQIEKKQQTLETLTQIISERSIVTSQHLHFENQLKLNSAFQSAISTQELPYLQNVSFTDRLISRNANFQNFTSRSQYNKNSKPIIPSPQQKLQKRQVNLQTNYKPSLNLTTTNSNPEFDRKQKRKVAFFFKQLLRKVQIKNSLQKKIVQLSSAFSLFDKIGGDTAISLITDHLFEYIANDNDLSCKMSLRLFIESFKDVEQIFLKQIFRRFLSYLLGKNVFYLIDTMRTKHKHLAIKTCQFDKFKAYLIQSLLKVIHENKLVLFTFAQKIESCRYLILNKSPMFAQVYNQKFERLSISTDICNAVLLLSNRMYSKIFSDLILCNFFKGIAQDEQAKKFAILMANIMNWDQEKNQESMQLLRKFHAGLHIQHIHLVTYKQHLIQTMRELGIKESEVQFIFMISQKMDGFKQSVLDQDTFYQVAEREHNGSSSFINKYFQHLIKDARLSRLLALKGKDFIFEHCQFIYHQFSKQHSSCLANQDITFIHKQKLSNEKEQFSQEYYSLNCKKGVYIIEEQEINAFSSSFLTLSKCYIPQDQTQQNDLKEQWYIYKQLILNRSCLGEIVGRNIIAKLQQKLFNKLQQTKIFQKYFQNIQYPIETHIQRICSFIFYNNKYYKQSDLKLLHQKLDISQNSYDTFCYFLENVLNDLGLDLNIIKQTLDQLASYKKCICSFQKEDQLLSQKFK